MMRRSEPNLSSSLMLNRSGVEVAYGFPAKLGNIQRGTTSRQVSALTVLSLLYGAWRQQSNTEAAY